MIRFRFVGIASPEYRFGVMVERADDGKFFCFAQRKFLADGKQTNLIGELFRTSSRFGGAKPPIGAEQLGMLYALNYDTPTNDSDPDKNWADGDYFLHYCCITPRAELEMSGLAVLYDGDDQVVVAKSPSVLRANINYGYAPGDKGPKSALIAAALTYDTFRR